MTRFEFIKLRLNEAEAEPISAGTSMLLDAVCALTEQVESHSVEIDARQLVWVGAYLVKLHALSNIDPEARRRAKQAAFAAVTDLDEFVAGEVPR